MLNYHHLRLFRAVARASSLTRAAQELHLSQSALSVQIQKLEAQLGHPLFARQGKRLVLTEAGRIALDHANTIFATGEELESTLAGRPRADRQPLRVGALTTLSRNFQLAFVRPVLDRPDVELVLRSATMQALIAALEAHALDVVLATAPVRRDAHRALHSHLLDQQAVSLVGRADLHTGPFRFPEDLADVPVLLPSLEDDVRAAFDRRLALAGVRPTIVAEVDDMAMLRVLARESTGLTLVPPIVVQDELRTGVLVERCRIPDVTERFYAIVPARRFPNPALAELLRGRAVLGEEM